MTETTEPVGSRSPTDGSPPSARHAPADGSPSPAPGAAPPLAPRRRRRWPTLLLALLLFASGLAAGAGATALLIVRRAQATIQQPERMPARLARHLGRRLDLSPEQSARVQAILAERQAALQEIRSRCQPEMEAELDRIEREVAAVIEGEQVERWERLFRRLRRAWVPPLPPGGRRSRGGLEEPPGRHP
jgi:cell division protein FtsB